MDEPTLERDLAKLAADPRHLHDRLVHAKDSARRIWANPRMPWFTDHTPDNHSRRIVHLLSQALGHLQQTPQRLRPVELFILLASCYLHDIGMQDLKKSGKAQQQFTEAEWEVVRDEHPSIVKEWIVTRSRASSLTEFRIDLGDSPEPYLELLGLVCQGHGSCFFESTVAELDQIEDEFDGHRVRGGLLTALLMLGDELDINRERASLQKEEDREPVGELHHAINGYTTSVRVSAGATQKLRHATLQLSTPDDDELVVLISEWLGRKLSSQIRRGNAVVEPATNGELRFDERVTFRVRTRGEVFAPMLTPPARAVLAEHVWRGRLLRPEIAKRLRVALEQPEARSSAIVLRSSSVGDHPSVLRWLDAAVAAVGGSLCVVPCRQGGGRGPVDILDIVAGELGVDASGYAEARRGVDEAVVTEEETRRLVEALASDVARVAARHLFALDIRGLDEASPETRGAVLDLATRVLSSGAPPVVLVTLERDAEVPLTTDIFALSELDESAIAAVFERALGYEPTRAAAQAATIFAAGKGAPLGITNALEAVELGDREVIRV